MSNLLSIQDWLGGKDAIRYAIHIGMQTDFSDFFRAYTACDYPLMLDFANPPFFICELGNNESAYPSRITQSFNEGTLVQMGNGILHRQCTPCDIAPKVVQKGYDQTEIVWVHAFLDEVFRELNLFIRTPAYRRRRVFLDNSWQSIYEFVSWGDLLTLQDNSLLFSRVSIDELLQASRGHKIEPVSNEYSASKMLTSKEKNSLLIVIAALCKEANIDYNKKGITNALVKMTEIIGASLSDDTIRKILKQIEGALDSRRK